MKPGMHASNDGCNTPERTDKKGLPWKTRGFGMNSANTGDMLRDQYPCPSGTRSHGSILPGWSIAPPTQRPDPVRGG